MDDKKQNKKRSSKIKHTNVIESLKDMGDSTVNTIKKDVIQETSKDFIRQLLGQRRSQRFSGEVSPGETLEFSEVMAGKREENLKLKKQIALERKLREEGERQSKEKIGELRVHLKALVVEVQKLASETEGLAKETQIAAMQTPIEPGVYHVVFFEKLLEFIKSFRQKIHEASVWLHATNKRAQKKNYWARYKKHGAKFLLSGEHYLTRSAG